MRFDYNSGNRMLTFEFVIQCDKPRRVRLIAYDADKPHTVFMDRYKTIGRTPEKLICRMPISPVKVTFEITDEQTGGDSGIKLVNRSRKRLVTNVAAFPYYDDKISSFINFSTEFCYKAGYLSAGTYGSDNGKFVIYYNPSIRNLDTGAKKNTPARINANTGEIEVSQEKFKEFTVAGRMAILLHEFCHVFANKNMRDEVEADYHAAQIYLGLGFPRIEILNVFSEVFLKADNEVNRLRFEKLKKFVDNFDSKIQSVIYF